jgi:hypothetical protein
MATLRELRGALFPGAATLGTPPAEGELDVPISWVRVLRARVPAFDGLEPGDVIVAPVSALVVIAGGASGIEELVEACRDGRAAAILATGPADDPAAERSVAEIARALERAAPTTLVGFRIEQAEPAALERSIVAFLVNARAELEHQAALLEARLERLALGSGELGTLVAEIATSLGRVVALEGPRGEVLAVHAPETVPGAAPAVRAYHARPAAAALRVALPAPSRGGQDGDGTDEIATAPAGRLVLIGDRPPSELERLTVERITGLMALQLAREDAVRRARDAVRQGESLPAAGPPWVVLVARQIPPNGSVPLEAREETRRQLRLLAPARQLGLRGSADSLELRVVAAPAAEDTGGLRLAERIARIVGRPVAVSRPFDLPTGRSAAEAEARATLEAVESIPNPPPHSGRAAANNGSRAAMDATGPTVARPGVPRVARAEHLPAYRLLGALHNLPGGSSHARALLAPLLVGRPALVADRLRTVRALLETAGPAEAAAMLGVHRNTIAYRARGIERLTGWRLSDPDLRLPLAVAVRIVQEEQANDD